ncbi:MAG: hypothetical protein ACXVEF_21025 [Polyangiales bacterium]
MSRSIFAVEICAPYEAGSPFHAGLRDLVRNHPETSGYQQKWAFYRRATELLLAALPTFERGCWDFFDEDARAKRDFEMWCDGLFTKEGPRLSPSGRPDPYRGDARYLTFTVAFLMIQGAPSERILSTRCNIPQADLWKRDAFKHVLEGIPYVNFASVLGDVVYLIPRDDEWGLTRDDLAHTKFDYLRTIG